MSFTVYRSSAGSGKTFTLVKEYLKILLKDPGDFRHILAITFTNKAANEMKERVLGALQGLSEVDRAKDPKIGSTLSPILSLETGMDQQEISRRSGQALEQILHNYSDFSIGTIDSFSHKVIRTFAHDFHLPVNFTVELETDQLLKTAVDLLLERVGEDTELTGLLVNFIENRLEDDQGWNIEGILSSFAKNLLDEDGQSRIERLRMVSLHQFQSISRALAAKIREFEQQVKAEASEATQLIASRNIPITAFSHGDKGIAMYFKNLSLGKFEKLDPNSYVRSNFEEDKWTSGKATATEREAIYMIIPDLRKCYNTIQLISNEQSNDYKLRKLLSKTIYPLAVLNEIEKVLDSFKKQNNLIHISEFNARIAGIVMNEPIPFIYERLGEKYQHLLIDEFQDTSALQWLNFIPLIENALAGGHFNLVVGDGKQAIYRWRGGDIEQFNVLPAIPGSHEKPLLKQREQALTNHYRKQNLDRNFRSKAEIVEFNNLFFSVISAKILTERIADIYANVQQKYDAQNTGGYIQLEFISRDEDGMAYEDVTFERILDITQRAVSDGYSNKDIAILCRSNKNASDIASFLLAQGIDVVSTESLLVGSSNKVRFIISFLNLMFRPSNDIVKEEVDHFLRSKTNSARPGQIGQMIKELSTLPVFELCETIIRNFDLNVPADPYLRFFLDVVLKFEGNSSYSTIDFLDFWDENSSKFSIIVPEELDAVKVMTIHKAKGLQFPIVILPFAREARKNTKSYLWVDLNESIAPGLATAILKSEKSMESTTFRSRFEDEQEKSLLDLLNVLYVAMTRPKEQLFILTSAPPANLESIDSLPKMFTFFLKSEGYFVEKQVEYKFGYRMGKREKIVKEKVDTIALDELISNDWRKKIMIRTKAPQSWDMDNPLGKTDRGIQFHAILSLIRTANDLSASIEQAVVHNLIETSEIEYIRNTLWAVINHPALAECFDPDAIIKNEPEILLPAGLFYRPDRVVIRGKSAMVLDYKTGSHRSEHSLQLIKYTGLISEMGYDEVKGFLVYLEPEVQVIQV